MGKRDTYAFDLQNRSGLEEGERPEHDQGQPRVLEKVRFIGRADVFIAPNEVELDHAFRRDR